MTRLLLLICLLLPVAPPVRAAAELEQLLASGQLTVNSNMDSAVMLVPGQRGRLVLEIATNSWFTGGTRIRIPEVPGLVILQTEQFAANASETRKGQSWVVQRWTLDVYPQRGGDFTIPPVTLAVKVNGGELGDLEGELQSPPVDFSVTIPPALEQVEFWVAAPQFSVEQRLDRDTDRLQPGDAIERRIEFRGEDVLAMMLPTFNEQRLPGLSAYPAPAELENHNNRGQATASRVQTITYVAEQPGDYLLPAQDFFWWNTQNGTLEVLSLPAITVHVEGATAASTATRERSLDRQVAIAGGAGVLLLLLLGWLLLHYRPWHTLSRWLQPLARLGRRAADLRKPALPEHLNPDSSAAHRKASGSR